MDCRLLGCLVGLGLKLRILPFESSAEGRIQRSLGHRRHRPRNFEHDEFVWPKAIFTRATSGFRHAEHDLHMEHVPLPSCGA